MGNKVCWLWAQDAEMTKLGLFIVPHLISDPGSENQAVSVSSPGNGTALDKQDQRSLLGHQEIIYLSCPYIVP